MSVVKVQSGLWHDRFLMAILAGAAVLVLAAVVIVLAAGQGTPPADPNAPAGVVWRYMQAVRGSDPDAAYAFLSSAARRATSAEDYRKTFRNPYGSNGENARVVLTPQEPTGDTAEVKVTVSRFYGGGPFSGGYTSHNETTVRLVREDGVWKIDSPTEPSRFRY